MPADSGGRYLYLRDNGSGAYWSPSWQPTQPDLDHYECRHGLSYPQITSAYLGVRAQTLYFVPPGETLEVWRLRVSNERDEPAEISVFSSVEFCLWDALDDASNFQRNYSTGEVEVTERNIELPAEHQEELISVVVARPDVLTADVRDADVVVIDPADDPGIVDLVELGERGADVHGAGFHGPHDPPPGRACLVRS